MSTPSSCQLAMRRYGLGPEGLVLALRRLQLARRPVRAPRARRVGRSMCISIVRRSMCIRCGGGGCRTCMVALRLDSTCLCAQVGGGLWCAEWHNRLGVASGFETQCQSCCKSPLSRRIVAFGVVGCHSTPCSIRKSPLSALFVWACHWFLVAIIALAGMVLAPRLVDMHVSAVVVYFVVWAEGEGAPGAEARAASRGDSGRRDGAPGAENACLASVVVWSSARVCERVGIGLACCPRLGWQRVA